VHRLILRPVRASKTQATIASDASGFSAMIRASVSRWG
jgi:hypothetical protein